MYHRRSFLQSLAAAACGLATGSLTAPSARAAEPFQLRYLLASAMYGGLKLAEILPEVKKTGATAIDLWPKKHGTQREELDALGHDRVAEMLQAHGLTLAATTRYDLGPFGLAEEIQVVKKMGGSLIVTGGAGNYQLTGDALKAEVKAFVEKLKPHAAQAAAAGVTIAIENHGKNLIDSPDSLRWLSEMIGDGVGIALAPYHLPQDPALIAELIRTFGPKLVLFYAWEYGQGCMKPMPKADELQQMPGRGSLDYRPILTALRSIGFTGPTEIFMHPTPRGLPILDSAAEVTAEINRARDHLTSLLAKL